MKMRSVIVCVDDDRYILHALSDQLDGWFGQNYIIEKALSGEEGLSIIDEYKEKNINTSVVISDYIMPVMRGDQFLEKVHKKDAAIKKIMLTGYSALEGVINVINKAGLYRFIAKPWDNRDLMLTILEAIKSYEQEQSMLRLTTDLKNLCSQYVDMLQDMRTCYDTTLESLVESMERRLEQTEQSIATGTHSLGVRYYAVELAKASKMTADDQYTMGCLGLLHEVGKLNLSKNELLELEKARRALDYANPVFQKLREQTAELMSGIHHDSFSTILADHYEKYKPSLSLQARVLTVANAFDNITRAAGSAQAARSKLLRLADDGSLDPQLVKALIQNIPIYEG